MRRPAVSGRVVIEPPEKGSRRRLRLVVAVVVGEGLVWGHFGPRLGRAHRIRSRFVGL